MKTLIQHLDAMALANGATLRHMRMFRPIAIERSAKHGDFSRGVLATILEVYALVGETPEGRQAIRDLGFEPFLQNVEGE